MKKTHLLFLVILIEGYVVLACELLAIRQLIPFVGSGTDVISIIISAVLLPLAIGYHFGGNAFKTAFSKAKNKNAKKLSIRKILLRNVLSATGILTLGLSYIFLELFFIIFKVVGIDNRLLQTALYSVVFLSFPVFLLGQTVPLVSNYFSRSKLSEITGKMLFFSTTGSFLGSVFSTIILMTYMGVHNTVIVTISLLCFLILLLMRSIFCFETVFCVSILAAIYGLNNGDMMKSMKIISNNAYNMVQIVDFPKKDERIMEINRSASSQIGKNPESRFPYIAYIEDNFIVPLMKLDSPPKDILVIGAGGFALGLNDTKNNYTFVDIDKDLQKVAEKYFLPEKLSANKQFVPISARAFVHSNDKKYDLIVIDTYTNMLSIPMETVTRGFLLDVKARLNDNGVIVANVVSSPIFSDKFSVRYQNTFASVFPVFSRQIVEHSLTGNSGLWHDDRVKENLANILYIYFNNKLVNDDTIYTDDKNSYSIDRTY